MIGCCHDERSPCDSDQLQELSRFFRQAVYTNPNHFIQRQRLVGDNGIFLNVLRQFPNEKRTASGFLGDLARKPEGSPVVTLEEQPRQLSRVVLQQRLDSQFLPMRMHQACRVRARQRL